jgi:hypothetical protein
MNRKHILALTALTGAVALAGCATLEEAAVSAVNDTYHASLTGANEPGGGAPNGMGMADITISDSLDQVCWNIHDVSGIDTPTAAHIHRGAPGVNGPVVVTLTMNNEGTWKGCAKRGSEWTQDMLKNNFANFYVNVHTATYPNGAIRGQLGN